MSDAPEPPRDLTGNFAGPQALAGSERRPLPGAVAKGRASPGAIAEVTLKLRRKAALSVSDAIASAPMTREAFAAAYGASLEDIAAVLATFEALGLTVLSTNPATRTVILTGSLHALERAFHVSLFDYAHAGGDYRGRIGRISLPAAVKDIVVGVFGLDNRRVARRRRPPTRDAPPGATSPAQAWWLPRELAARYNYPPGDGAGETVGLLQFGGGYFPSDLARFCEMAGIASPPKVVAISADGTATDRHDGVEGEVMLDIEVVAGACPKADIAVYFARWTEAGWLANLDAALHDAANAPGVLSISWGHAEDRDLWTAQAMTQVNEALMEAIAMHVTVCVATGDDGSSDAVADGPAHVDFPSSSPLVLAVGGTTIPDRGAPGPDIVWKQGDGLYADGGGATGGGVSAIFLRPAWQGALDIVSVNPGALVGRCVPDLAANADWTASPYLVVVNGQAEPNGGTSAACPLVAGLIALINAARVAGGGARIGYLTPLLYQGQAGADGPAIGSIACTDVVTGDNATAAAGGYSAGPGYDAASGWGTPNGAALLAALP